jgi:hypothetical protein
MLPAGSETLVPQGELPQNHTLDCVPTGFCCIRVLLSIFKVGTSSGLNKLTVTLLTQQTLFIVRHRSGETAHYPYFLSAFFQTVVKCEDCYYTSHLLTYLTSKERTGTDLTKVAATVHYYSVTKYLQDNAQNSLLCGPLHFLAEKARVLSYRSGGKNGVEFVCTVGVSLWSHNRIRSSIPYRSHSTPHTKLNVM